MNQVAENFIRDILLNSNFYRNIELSERNENASFSRASKIFGCLALIMLASMFLFVAIEWIHGVSMLSKRYDMFMKLTLIVWLVGSVLLFSSTGLNDMLASKQPPHLRHLGSPIFYIVFIAESLFTAFVMWLQLSSLIGNEEWRLIIERVQIWAWFGFGIVPLLVYGYKTVNADGLIMFIKVVIQSFEIWFKSAYNGHSFKYCPHYPEITKKHLKWMSIRNLDKLEENVLKKVQKLDKWGASGFAVLWLFWILSVVFWTTVSDIFKLLNLGIENLSRYIGIAHLSYLLWEISLFIIVVLIVIFVWLLVLRKASVTVLDQISAYKSEYGNS